MAYSTIPKSSSYFNTKLYTGTGSSQVLTGVGFSPDLIWTATRNESEIRPMNDSVNGINNYLRSNDSDTLETSGTNITAQSSDGYTVGTTDRFNQSSNSFVSWNWKAGTTGSGTSSGSGTGKAYSYSVSTTSGFSIVKYVGNGTAGHTIPHHLGAVPKMIIAKNLGRGEHWRVYQSSLGNAHKLNLNNTTASASATEWNSTTPTSSVFSIGTGEQINYNNDNYIAYCFADVQGFSKVSGSYYGNGNSNGIFLYCGFKPAFIVLKNTIDGAKNWEMLDNKRPSSGQNPADDILFPDTVDAESASQTDRLVDFVSNGVKIRGNSAQMNANGQKFIFMAFAEAPLVGSNNVPTNAR